MCILPDQFITKTTSMPMELAVSMGRVNGFSKVDKFGVNQQITTSTDPEDIWEFGGEYNYDENGTAPIAYLSSSDALDVGMTISVQGLDINGNYIAQDIEIDGQNVVLLETPLWRVYRMQNISDTGKDLAGILYCHTDPNPTAGVPAAVSVRAIINNGNNQTLMALYTIPKGKVGFLYRGEIGVELEGSAAALAEYAHCHYASRRYGKIFTVKKAVTCIVGGGSSLYQDYRSFPDVIPALTDIKITAIEVSQTMGLFATFDILLVDQERLEPSYLAAIGQPGV